MSILELGALGELVGAIAVVVTLGYLAAQIRQNTSAQRSNSSLETTRAFTDWYSIVMADAELVRIFSAGFQEDAETLSNDDRGRFVWMMAALTSRIELMYSQHRAGLIDDDRWLKYRGIVLGCMENQVVKEWWDSGATVFGSDFVDEIESAQKDQGAWKFDVVEALGVLRRS